MCQSALSDPWKKKSTRPGPQDATAGSPLAVSPLGVVGSPSQLDQLLPLNSRYESVLLELRTATRRCGELAPSAARELLSTPVSRKTRMSRVFHRVRMVDSSYQTPHPSTAAPV